MAPIEPTTHDQDPGDETRSLRRRRTVRLLVPVAVAGVAAGTIGLVPALADSGSSDPKLPGVTAEELVTKLAGTQVDTFSGTVKISTDLGLPGLIAGGASGAGSSPFGPGAEGEEDAEGAGATADPRSQLPALLSGSHTVRVAVDGPDKQRLSIVDETSEYSLIHNADQVWAYDSATNQVFHAEGGDHRAPGGQHEGRLPAELPTPQEAAEQALAAVDATTSVTVDGTSEVAGRDAYDLLITPKQDGSTVGSVRIAVDAENGAPLKFTLTPKGSERAAVDIGFTKVSFAEPKAGSFDFTPPKGAEVTEAEDLREKADAAGESARGSFEDLAGLGLNPGDVSLIGEGWDSVLRTELPEGVLSGKAFEKGKQLPEGFDPKTLLNSLGDRVDGDFGEGTVITSRLVNVLVTDDGQVYLGAVTKDALIAAAEK